MTSKALLPKKKITLGFVSNFVETDKHDGGNSLRVDQGSGCDDITCDGGGRRCQGKCQNYYPDMHELQLRIQGRKHL